MAEGEGLKIVLYYRFFYVDERKPDGNVKGAAIDGPAHAEFFVDLVEGEASAPWQATFVAGQGYVDFSKGKGNASKA